MESSTATSPEADNDKPDIIAYALSKDTTPENKRELKKSEVFVAGNVSLAEIEELRASLGDSSDDEADVLVETARVINDTLPKLDDQDPAYYARQRHRGELKHALLADDKSFDKMSLKWEKRARNELGGINFGAVTETIKSKAGSVKESLGNRLPSGSEARAQRRERRGLEKKYDGLLSNIVNVNWTQDELDTIYDTYHAKTADIQARGGEVDETNQATAAYTEAARLAASGAVDSIMADADARGFFRSEAQKDITRAELNKDIHDYVRQSSDTKDQFDNDAGRLIELYDEYDNRERLTKRVGTRAKLIGAAALAGGIGAGAGALRDRWNKHRAEKHAARAAEDDDEDDTGSERSKKRLRDIPLAAYINHGNRRAAKREAEQERLNAMNDAEREDYLAERKRFKRDIKIYIGLAAGALAMAGAIKYGLDIDHDSVSQHSGNKLPHGGDLGHVPGENGELPVKPVKPPVEVIPSSKADVSTFFTGREGSTHFNAKGVADVKEWLNANGGYDVQKGDTVWKDVAHDYLKQKGINNPSISQIDAVKDQMEPTLRSYGFTDKRGFLRENDTINFK